MIPVDIAICGAGGTGVEAVDMLDLLNAREYRYHCIGFLDDRLDRGATVAGLPVLGPLSAAASMSGVRFIDGLGSPAHFRQRAASLRRSGISPEDFLTVIHPQACISPRASIGPGSLVFAHVVVGAGAQIGAHVTVLPLSVIHHGAVVGDWSIIASHVGISGRAKLGESCYIGTGAQVIQDCVIGEGAMIGMGAVVRHPVSAESTVAGNPAVPLRREGFRNDP